MSTFSPWLSSINSISWYTVGDPAQGSDRLVAGLVVADIHRRCHPKDASQIANKSRLGRGAPDHDPGYQRVLARGMEIITAVADLDVEIARRQRSR